MQLTRLNREAVRARLQLAAVDASWVVVSAPYRSRDGSDYLDRLRQLLSVFKGFALAHDWKGALATRSGPDCDSFFRLLGADSESGLVGSWYAAAMSGDKLDEIRQVVVETLWFRIYECGVKGALRMAAKLGGRQATLKVVCVEGGALSRCEALELPRILDESRTELKAMGRGGVTLELVTLSSLDVLEGKLQEQLLVLDAIDFAGRNQSWGIDPMDAALAKVAGASSDTQPDATTEFPGAGTCPPSQTRQSPASASLPTTASPQSGVAKRNTSTTLPPCFQGFKGEFQGTEVRTMKLRKPDGSWRSAAGLRTELDTANTERDRSAATAEQLRLQVDNLTNAGDKLRFQKADLVAQLKKERYHRHAGTTKLPSAWLRQEHCRECHERRMSRSLPPGARPSSEGLDEAELTTAQQLAAGHDLLEQAKQASSPLRSCCSMGSLPSAYRRLR